MLKLPVTLKHDALQRLALLECHVPKLRGVPGNENMCNLCVRKGERAYFSSSAFRMTDLRVCLPLNACVMTSRTVFGSVTVLISGLPLMSSFIFLLYCIPETSKEDLRPFFHLYILCST